LIKLIDKELPPALKLVSGRRYYSEVWSDLSGLKSLPFDVLNGDVKYENDVLFVDAAFFVSQRKIHKWLARLKAGYINLKITEENNSVLYFKSSDLLQFKTYNFSEYPDIRKINFSLLKKHYGKFRSRTKNNVLVSDEFIQKSSSEIDKISAEFNFLVDGKKKFPFYVDVFDYKFDDGKASYKMPLILPGDVSSFYLENDTIFFKKNNFGNFCINYFQSVIGKNNYNHNEKFISILRDRLDDRHSSFKKFLRNIKNKNYIVNHLITISDEIYKLLYDLFDNGSFAFINNSPVGNFHGDFCLSNILFDKQSDTFFLVDPRGDPELPICLDVAKLSHSLVGSYDTILAGHYYIELTEGDLELKLHQDVYFHTLFRSILNSIDFHSFEEIRLLEAYLFFTMLIHHKNDLKRCLAFLIQSRGILSSLGHINSHKKIII
jgi:hypothetical protein